jgi:hypothetical protein
MNQDTAPDLGQCEFCPEPAIVLWPVDPSDPVLSGRRTCDACAIAMLPHLVKAARRYLRAHGPKPEKCASSEPPRRTKRSSGERMH